MKKVKIIVLFIFVFMCCTGCVANSEVTRGLRHAGFTLSGEDFSCDALIPKSNKEYEVIKYLGANYAITTTGVIHELSFGQLFSNGEYCKKAETDLTVQAVIGDEVFRAQDNKIYFLKSGAGVSYTEVPPENPSYSAYKFFLDDHNVVKVQNVGDSLYYVLKTDGDIYSYKLGKNNANGVHLISSGKIYTAEAYGSKIVDFNYAGNSSEATFVRTEDSIYRNSALNREECTKYVDVVCEYQFGKDEDLSKFYNNIIAYNGNMIITDYLKVFNLGGKS